MIYKRRYESPIGGITITSNGKALTGLAFDDGRFFEESVPEDAVALEKSDAGRSGAAARKSESKTAGTAAEGARDIFRQTEEWLDIYFTGRDPGFTPPVDPDVSEFRRRVCEIMLDIPFGKYMTYGQIASMIAEERGIARMSAQAVGGAVGHNPISLIIPCHRVIGSDGSLTGYGSGLDKKYALLTLENSEALKHTGPQPDSISDSEALRHINSRLYSNEKCDKILWHVDESGFMQEALREAEKAYGENEVPVGAVVVKDGKIIGRGHNMTEGKKDPTAHAEILAIRQAAAATGGWRLTGCDLYVTVEPCAMCAGAIVWSRIRTVYIGTPDPKAGACGSVNDILQDERLNHRANVRKGLMQEESARLMKDFFRKLRLNKPEE